MFRSKNQLLADSPNSCTFMSKITWFLIIYCLNHILSLPLHFCQSLLPRFRPWLLSMIYLKHRVFLVENCCFRFRWNYHLHLSCRQRARSNWFFWNSPWSVTFLSAAALSMILDECLLASPSTLCLCDLSTLQCSSTGTDRLQTAFRKAPLLKTKYLLSLSNFHLSALMEPCR